MPHENVLEYLQGRRLYPIHSDGHPIGVGGLNTVYQGSVRYENHSKPCVIRISHHNTREAVLGSTRRMEAYLGMPNLISLLEEAVQPRDVHGRLYHVNDEIVAIWEFADDGSLKQKMEQGKPLGIEESLKILEQVATGLNVLEEVRNVHGDISDDNILFKDGQACLSDFDLCAFVGLTEVTHTGRGKPAYLPPEAHDVNGRRELHPTADIFALGVLYALMRTGTYPFGVEPDANGNMVPRRALRDSVPVLTGLEAWEQRWIAMALSSETDKRYFGTQLLNSPDEKMRGNAQRFASALRTAFFQDQLTPEFDGAHRRFQGLPPVAVAEPVQAPLTDDALLPPLASEVVNAQNEVERIRGKLNQHSPQLASRQERLREKENDLQEMERWLNANRPGISFQNLQELVERAKSVSVLPFDELVRLAEGIPEQQLQEHFDKQRIFWESKASHEREQDAIKLETTAEFAKTCELLDQAREKRNELQIFDLHTFLANDLATKVSPDGVFPMQVWLHRCDLMTRSHRYLWDPCDDRNRTIKTAELHWKLFHDAVKQWEEQSDKYNHQRIGLFFTSVEALCRPIDAKETRVSPLYYVIPCRRHAIEALRHEVHSISNKPESDMSTRMKLDRERYARFREFEDLMFDFRCQRTFGLCLFILAILGAASIYVAWTAFFGESLR